MKKLYRISLSAFFITAGLLASPYIGSGHNQLLSSAWAQDKAAAPVILIINRAVLLSESKAGKNISEQALVLREKITKELQDEFEKIKKDEESLLAQQTLLAPEVLRQRAEELQVRGQNFDVHQQIKNREFQASIQNASAEIAKVLEPILTELIAARSATLLLDQSQVMFASPDIDVTAEVMKKLDDKLKKVKVERVKIDIPAKSEE